MPVSNMPAQEAGFKMVLRCKKCGEIIEVPEAPAYRTQIGERTEGHKKIQAPRCPDCQAWAWELCGEGDEEGV